VWQGASLPWPGQAPVARIDGVDTLCGAVRAQAAQVPPCTAYPLNRRFKLCGAQPACVPACVRPPRPRIRRDRGQALRVAGRPGVAATAAAGRRSDSPISDDHTIPRGHGHTHGHTHGHSRDSRDGQRVPPVNPQDRPPRRRKHVPPGPGKALDPPALPHPSRLIEHRRRPRAGRPRAEPGPATRAGTADDAGDSMPARDATGARLGA
jgi:hypothetical protein